MPPNLAKIRDDLLYYPDPADDSRQFVKDPIRTQFYRYNELQVEMMKALDGKRSVDDVKALLEDKFDADIPAVSIDRFITRLEQNHLLDLTSYTVDDEKTRKQILIYLRKRGLALRVKARDSSSAEGKLFEAGTRELLEGDPCKAAVYLQGVLELNPNNERARQVIMATHEAFFKTKTASVSHAKLVHAFNPDRFLGAVDRVFGRFVFSPVGAVVLALVILSGISPAISVLSQPSLRSFSAYDFMVMWVLRECGNFFHELSHGFACKHYGGRVTDVGWMFFYGLIPTNYCDTSDAYLFSTKRAKIVVQLAGVLSSLLLISLLFHFLSLSDPSFPFWGGFAWGAISLLLLVPSNAVPFVKFDAYYALSDYLGIANLRERAFEFLRDGLKQSLFGVPSKSPTPTPRERRVFLIYGTLACIYSVFFIYVIYIGFILPLAIEFLGTLGIVMAAMFFINLIGRTMLSAVIKFFLFLFRERRIIFTRRRTFVIVGAVAALIAGLAAPWPLYVDGGMVVEPRGRAEVRVTEPGLIAQLRVREGDRVEAGQLLAVLRADDLVRDRAVAAAEMAIESSRLEQLRKGARPEEIRLASARAREGAVGSMAAARRLQDTSTLNKLQVASGEEILRARGEASHAGGEARVASADAVVATAGARVEDLAVAEANVRRWEAQIADLDARLARLEIRSPIAGVVVTKRVQERLGERLEAGVPLLEVHDTSRWRARVVPDRGEPLTGLAAGQKVLVAAEGAPHDQAELTVDEILPPADGESGMVIYTTSLVHEDWRSGMTGQARIYAPKRSVAYRLLVLPVVRLVEHELPRI